MSPSIHHSLQTSRRFGAALALLALTGCASTSSSTPSTLESVLPMISQLGVYKLDINQGNFLSQDMVARLKVGQTRQQVRLALGTPLVMTVFRENRWDYVYQFSQRGRVKDHRMFTVYFQDDLLARWEGDEMPQSAQDLNRLSAERSLPEDPYGQDAGIMGKIIDFFKKIGDPSASPTP
ncbi:MAG: outer membrane protein assembly factor BamE [Betaproteobacteria bacterium]